MHCRRAQSWIDEALDGGLPGARQPELDAHLEGCPVCRRQWEALRSADAALRAPQPVAPPAGMLLEFRERLAQEQEAGAAVRGPARSRGWSWLWPASTLAAAAAAVLLITMRVGVPPGPPVSTDRMVRSYEAPPALPDAAPVPFNKAAPESARTQPAAPAAPPASTAGSSAPAPATAEKKQILSDKLAAVPSPAASKVTQPMATVEEQRKDLGGRERIVLARPVVPVPELKDAVRPGTPEARPDGLGQGLAGGGLGGVGGPGSGGGRFGGFGGAAPRPEAKKEELPARAPAPAGSVVAGKPEEKPAVVALSVVDADKKLPVEFEVSTAVLEALQRPVAIRLDAVPLRMAIRRLTVEGDVTVEIDPRTPTRTVSVDEGQTPLWKVLETVAKQSNLRIYPQDNEILLRPAELADVQLGDRAVLKTDPAAGVAPKRAAAPPVSDAVRSRLEKQREAEKPRGGVEKPNTVKERREPAQQNTLARNGYFLAVPQNQAVVADRTVWAAEWGVLPERGFMAPTQDEFAAYKNRAPATLQEQPALQQNTAPPAAKAGDAYQRGLSRRGKQAK